MVPKDIYVLILEPVNVTLHCRRDFADVIKDTETGRSSWFIQMGSTYNHKCPFKRKAERKTQKIRSM